MERIRIVKRDPSKNARERVEPKEELSGPSPMIPIEKPNYRLALWAEEDVVYLAISIGEEIHGYRRKYGSEEIKSAYRSPHVLIGRMTVEELVRGMLLEDTLEELKKLRGALDARTKRVKDRGVRDALPYLLPRITLEDLKRTHGIIVTDISVDFDALIISSDGEAVRPKEDVSTKLLEALIKVSKVEKEYIDNDLRVVLNEYHAGRGEEILETIVLEAPLERIPELVKRMKSLGLKAVPRALVASIRERLKKDIDSLLAVLAIYVELSDLRVDRLVERIEKNATEILLEAPEDKAREARRMLRDAMPELAKRVAKEIILKKEIGDEFASELSSVADLTREEALEALKRAEKLGRKKAAANIFLKASPTVDEVKELKRSPEYALEIARLLGKEGVSLYHRLLDTRLAEEAARDMVSLGIIDEILKSRLLKFSKRNPLKAAEIARPDKKLLKRLIDSIYEGLESTRFSMILAENVDVLERERIEERIIKRLDAHEPNERLIEVVVKKKADKAAERLAEIRAKKDRRELVNKIVEGFDKSVAKRIVDKVTVEDLLPMLALKPHLAVKRFKEGLLVTEKFESIESTVLEALGFDDIIDLIRTKRLTREGIKKALEAAVKKIDSRGRVLYLLDFSKELKLYKRVKPRIAQHAKLLKPEASEDFERALRELGDAFGVEYVKERYEEVREILKGRRNGYVGRLFVIADPKEFEKRRKELDSEASAFLTPEVQPLVPNVVKSLALSGHLKPVYPYEVYRYIGKLPEYLERTMKGEKIKLDTKSLDSVGELRKIAAAFRNSSFVKKRPVAFAHAIGALRILSRGDEELREVYKRVIDVIGKAESPKEVSVKLPPGLFGGKAKRFAKDIEAQRSILRLIIDAPYLDVTEEGLKAIDLQREVEIKRAKKKMFVKVKKLE